jgi:uncharacterized protein (TIGR02145 family)
MKRIFLALFFFFCVHIHYGQTITLNFTGQDSITQNYVALDSVHIYNFTAGCDTNLLGPKPKITLEVLVGINGISPTSEDFTLTPSMHNPFNGLTSIGVYLNFKKSLSLLLIDGLGNKIAEHKGDFEVGLNKFEISSSIPNLLILKVSDGRRTKSIKLINSCNGFNINEIHFLGANSILKGNYKNSRSFYFSIGDLLVYKAYSNGYNDKTLSDSPIGDFTYVFHMSKEDTLATVLTDSVYNPTATTISCGGNVISDGGSPVMAYGVCWGETPNPTISDNNFTVDGSGLGIFISNLITLMPTTIYYIRSYATNNVGTAYGNEIIFTTLSDPCLGIISIIYEEKIYNIIPIGTKCWFKDNLDVGAQINVSINQENNDQKEKYCYNDLEVNCTEYGGLYQWAEMVQYLNGATNSNSWDPIPTGNVQGLCPDGWHIPTASEWEDMITVIGGSTIAGGESKEIGYSHWSPPNTGASNETGFTALAGGARGFSGFYGDMGICGYYYTCTEHSQVHAYYRYPYYDVADFYNGYAFKTMGSSVRCVKD